MSAAVSREKGFSMVEVLLAMMLLVVVVTALSGYHRALAARLHSIKGYAMVSSYDCPLMQELYGDWYMVRFPRKRNNLRSTVVNGSGTLVQECVWCNYTPPVVTQKLF